VKATAVTDNSWMYSMLKFVNRFLSLFDVCIIRKRWLEESLRGNRTMEKKLQLVSTMISHPNTIFDLGAAKGEWSEIAIRSFPRAHFVLLEPLAERLEMLRSFRNKYSNSEIVNSAAGNEDGHAELSVTDDLDGSAIGVQGCTNGRSVPTARLDTLASQGNLSAPFLIKFDTHGYEKKILQGAAGILAETNCIVMECYNFKISPSAVLFWEMCEFLDDLGFRVVDIADPWPRKLDGILWQMDVIWLRKEHPIFQQTTYN